MGGMTRKIRWGGRPMTAIVLAGGRSRRMKADKAALDVGGRTLLEHVLDQIEPFFDEVLVSISPGQKPALAAGAAEPPRPRSKKRSGGSSSAPRFIEDETPDLGPLGGILSGLKSAANEACAVIACDVPDIDLPLLRTLASATCGSEITVPVGPSGLYEPLFAIYRKSVIPQITALLGSGERSILPLFGRCRTVVVQFEDAGRIRNLNTRADYESYLSTIHRPAADRSRGRGGRRVKDGSKGDIRSTQFPGRGAKL